MAVDREYGRWELDGDRLLLLSERRTFEVHSGEYSREMPVDDPNETLSMMSSRFIPVQWERRIYLVDEHELPAFSYRASIKTGYEAFFRNERQPIFEYLKFPANQPDAYEIQQAYPPLNPNSRPVLPVRYRTFYERGPIRAKVVKILPKGKQGDIPANTVRVLLSKGANARIKPGLLLVTMREDGYATLIVTAVRPGESEAVRFDTPGPRKDSIRVGDTFSSGEHGDLFAKGKGLYLPLDTRTPLPQWAVALREAWNG